MHSESLNYKTNFLLDHYCIVLQVSIYKTKLLIYISWLFKFHLVVYIG